MEILLSSNKHVNYNGPCFTCVLNQRTYVISSQSCLFTCYLISVMFIAHVTSPQSCSLHMSHHLSHIHCTCHLTSVMFIAHVTSPQSCSLHLISVMFIVHVTASLSLSFCITQTSSELNSVLLTNDDKVCFSSS